MDGFSERHSVGSATWNGKTVFFGGQDVIQDRIFNDLYVYHHDKNEFEKIEYIK